MTAHTHTGQSNKKAGRTDGGIDPETLLCYIRDQGRVSLEGVATRAGITERECRRHVMTLRERGLVDVSTGLRAVWITPTVDDVDDPDLTTDGGGPVQRLVHALTDSQESVGLTADELYECLNNERRRRIIRFTAAFYDRHESVYVAVDTLADALADRITTDETPPAREDTIRHRHYVSITQQHAPALDEYGLVEYFERVQMLRATEAGVTVAALITEIDDLCGDADQRGDE